MVVAQTTPLPLASLAQKLYFKIQMTLLTRCCMQWVPHTYRNRARVLKRVSRATIGNKELPFLQKFVVQHNCMKAKANCASQNLRSPSGQSYQHTDRTDCGGVGNRSPFHFQGSWILSLEERFWHLRESNKERFYKDVTPRSLLKAYTRLTPIKMRRKMHSST